MKSQQRKFPFRAFVLRDGVIGPGTHPALFYIPNPNPNPNPNISPSPSCSASA